MPERKHIDYERFYKYDSVIAIVETWIIVISLRDFVLYFIFAYFGSAECSSSTWHEFETF